MRVRLAPCAFFDSWSLYASENQLEVRISLKAQPLGRMFHAREGQVKSLRNGHDFPKVTRISSTAARPCETLAVVRFISRRSLMGS